MLHGQRLFLCPLDAWYLKIRGIFK